MSKEDIPDLGRIKYWAKYDASKVYFGEVQNYNDEAKTQWK